jgi:hypothetical protein
LSSTGYEDRLALVARPTNIAWSHEVDEIFGPYASGQGTWSARCVETRTPGAAGGSGKPTRSNPGRAPRSDPTKNRYRSEHHLARYDPASIDHLGLTE